LAQFGRIITKMVNIMKAGFNIARRAKFFASSAWGRCRVASFFIALIRRLPVPFTMFQASPVFGLQDTKSN
jgi:hypothetical protein